jgi:2-phospho-L-lactate guanylyltransferase
VEAPRVEPNEWVGKEKRTVAIVPVKSLSQCKQRLASQYSPKDRAELSLAMLSDVMNALQRSGWLEEVWVVSPDPQVLQHAASCAAVGVPETEGGLNPAVQEALALAAKAGFEAALIVHSDLPGLNENEVHAIRAEMANAAPNAVGVALSKDGGTSALYLSPIDALTPQFGKNSGKLHIQGALRLGLPVRLIELPGLTHDIDLPGDIEPFLRLNRTGYTHQILSSRLERQASLLRR